MKKLITGLMLLIATVFTVTAQTFPERPKLVVGIVVDHLPADFLYRYEKVLKGGGFNRLARQGVNCKNTQFSYQYSQTATDNASIFTGTNPAYHGIISKGWFSRMSGKVELADADSKTTIVGTATANKGKSPQKMLATTIGDKLKMMQSKSQVIGIGINATSTIFSAGHTADAVYWLDDFSGNFVTSSFYQDTVYSWVDTFNQSRRVDNYLNRVWSPLHETTTINDAMLQKLGIDNHFVHNLSMHKNITGYKDLKASPYGNSVLKEFAEAAIKHQKLGKDDATDLLIINFSCLNEQFAKYSPNSPEMVDSFLRLDRELSHLLDIINENVGLQNTLIFLTANQPINYQPKMLEANKIPSGYFSVYNAVALLKSYLSANYGAGDWIQNYNAQQIYLNHRLIGQKKVNLAEIQQKSAQFLLDFTGVANAIPANQLTNSGAGVLQKVQRSYNVKRSGDVFIVLEPGWLTSGKNNDDKIADYSIQTRVPLLWYGWKVRPRTVTYPVAIEDILPTLSNFLNIATPNGCYGSIIEEVGQ